MACFVVPAVEAIVTTIAQKVIKKQDNRIDKGEKSVLKLSDKLGTLNKMLWGGSGLLAFEHLWHGEISPIFPFLTAASDVEERAVMLREMAFNGSAMAVVVTSIWAAMMIISDKTRTKNKYNLLSEGEKV